MEIDRFQEDANAEVQEMQQALQAEFQEKLRPIVDGMVKELAIGLLFSAGDAGAIYVDPSLDITAEVIKRFDTAMASKPAGRQARRTGNGEACCTGAVNAEARSAASGAACRSAGDAEACDSRAHKTLGARQGRWKRAEGRE